MKLINIHPMILPRVYKLPEELLVVAFHALHIWNYPSFLQVTPCSLIIFDGIINSRSLNPSISTLHWFLFSKRNHQIFHSSCYLHNHTTSKLKKYAQRNPRKAFSL